MKMLSGDSLFGNAVEHVCLTQITVRVLRHIAGSGKELSLRDWFKQAPNLFYLKQIDMEKMDTGN